ncbi:hypothetical protein [Delftia deserti]|uniref:Uncharacterized protein n=1 Tax=Delftia deserti TaxID=1651218 RepID=A0ABW5EN85_9BURK
MESLPPFRVAGFFAGRTAAAWRAIARLPVDAAAVFLQKYGAFVREPQNPLLQCEALRL